MHAPFGFLLPSDESSAIGGVVAEQMESAPLLAQGKRKYVPYVDDWCSTPRPLTCSHPAAQPRGRIAFFVCCSTSNGNSLFRHNFHVLLLRVNVIV